MNEEKKSERAYKFFKRGSTSIEDACKYLGKDKVYKEYQKAYNKADTPLAKMTVASYFKNRILKLFPQFQSEIEDEEEYED